MDAVPHRVRVNAFGLHEDGLLGDQSLKHGLVGTVAGKERLIREEHRAVLQVSIEVPDKMLRVDDMLEVRAKEAPKLLRENTLADTLLTSEHYGNFALPLGVLRRVGHPTEQVLRVLGIAAADVVQEMG